MSSPDTLESDRLKRLRQQQEELAQKIRLEESRLKEQARKDETRRKILAGAVALDLAGNHPQFRALLYEALDLAVTAERDRALLGLASSSPAGPQASGPVAPIKAPKKSRYRRTPVAADESRIRPGLWAATTGFRRPGAGR